MFATVFRVLILFVIVLICMRLMGKRAIGEMQPFELVITLIIADLATIPMAQHTLPLLNGIIPVVTLLLIHFLCSLLAQKSLFFRRALSGKSVVIVNPSGIDFKQLKKLNMNFNDLVEALRQESISSFDDVLYVIVETSGKISVIPKAKASPLTSVDMGVKKDETTLPITVVADGKLLKTNTQLLGITAERVCEFAKKLTGETTRIKDICLFTIDPSGKAFIQKYGAASVSATVNFKGNDL